METGLNDYWSQRWISPKPVGSMNSVGFAEVDFNKCSAIIYFLCFAIVISAVLFCTELIISKFRENKNSSLYEKFKTEELSTTFERMADQNKLVLHYFCLKTFHLFHIRRL